MERQYPDLMGDYYPLTPHSISEKEWLAWQFNRPEKGDGIVQAFRRPGCPNDSLVCRLRGLDPTANYEISALGTEGLSVRSGKELMEPGLTVAIPRQPDAVVLKYQRIHAAR
jgi:alpha-galactosidase